MGYDFTNSEKESYIITRTSRASIGKITPYTENLKTHVENLKTKEGKNIFCDGGAELVN